MEKDRHHGGLFLCVGDGAEGVPMYIVGEALAPPVYPMRRRHLNVRRTIHERTLNS